MADFLKNHPFVSAEDYMWKMNPCLIRLMCVDNTRVHYLSEKEKERKKARRIDGSCLTNDLGIPVIGGKGKTK